MLNRDIDQYLAIRRANGFQEGLLRDFERYAAARNEGYVRRQTAVDWAAQAPSPQQRDNRLATVRLFADHVRAEDPRHETIPQQLFAGPRRRSIPFLFSANEIRQLLEATGRLRPRGSLRADTYRTLFGLLAVTGLRISEARHLRLDDVTKDGLLIRMTKFRKSRQVPLHPSVDEALRHYLELRNVYAREDDHVFISNTGKPLTYAMINKTFHYLISLIQCDQHPNGVRPRIHDLRHGFAVRSLEGCHGTVDEVARHTLALSTYLGHAHVADTYWYLHATPLLVRDIADACEAGEAP